MAVSVMGCAGALDNVIFAWRAVANCTVDWLPAIAVLVTLLFIEYPSRMIWSSLGAAHFPDFGRAIWHCKDVLRIPFAWNGDACGHKSRGWILIFEVY